MASLIRSANPKRGLAKRFQDCGIVVAVANCRTAPTRWRKPRPGCVGCRIDLWRWRPQVMKRKPDRKEKRCAAKSILQPEFLTREEWRSEEHTSELQSLRHLV